MKKDPHAPIPLLLHAAMQRVGLRHRDPHEGWVSDALLHLLQSELFVGPLFKLNQDCDNGALIDGVKLSVSFHDVLTQPLFTQLLEADELFRLGVVMANQYIPDTNGFVNELRGKLQGVGKEAIAQALLPPLRGILNLPGRVRSIRTTTHMLGLSNSVLQITCDQTTVQAVAGYLVQRNIPVTLNWVAGLDRYQRSYDELGNPTRDTFNAVGAPDQDFGDKIRAHFLKRKLRALID